MLEGRRFTIFTDHKPLKYALSRVSDRWNARQACQLSYEAEYTLDIRHLAGVDNVVADTFSRLPALIRLECRQIFFIYFITFARLGGGCCKGARWVCGCHLECRPSFPSSILSCCYPCCHYSRHRQRSGLDSDGCRTASLSLYSVYSMYQPSSSCFTIGVGSYPL
jgi:hypothetical protein